VAGFFSGPGADHERAREAREHLGWAVPLELGPVLVRADQRLGAPNWCFAVKAYRHLPDSWRDTRTSPAIGRVPRYTSLVWRAVHTRQGPSGGRPSRLPRSHGVRLPRRQGSGSCRRRTGRAVLVQVDRRSGVAQSFEVLPQLARSASRGACFALSTPPTSPGLAASEEPSTVVATWRGRRLKARAATDIAPRRPVTL
jgi:hypothetical protein